LAAAENGGGPREQFIIIASPRFWLLPSLISTDRWQLIATE